MNKVLKLILIISSLIIGLSCNLPSSAPQQAIETSTIAAVPAETQPTTTSAPIETIAPASATPELAPLCTGSAESVAPPEACHLPIAEESSTFCSNKYPYNLIVMNKGSTYTTVDKKFRCTDAGMKDGRQLATCTGNMASEYEVSVCDSACVAPTVEATITQCPVDYVYNSVQGCCMQGLQPVQQNCVTLKLKTISCVVDCSVYIKASTCNNHYIACIWKDKSKTCEARK